MRMKKFIVVLMAVTLLATGINGSEYTIDAQAAQAQSIVFNEENLYLVVKPGETNHIKLPIKAIGSNILQASADVTDLSENSLFTFSKPILTTKSNQPTDIVVNYDTTYVDFDVTVKETAEIGSYPVRLLVKGMDYNYDSWEMEEYNRTIDFKLLVLEEKAPIQLTISKVVCKNPLIGADTELSFVIKNEGEITARNVYINLNYGDTGIVKKYTAKNVKINDLAPMKEQIVTLPITILSTAGEGNKALTVNFEYKDIDGLKKTDAIDINFNVKKNEKAPDIYIEDVIYKGDLRQGEEFILVATLHNLGGSEAKEIYVSVDDSNIGKEGFIKKYTTDIRVPDMKKDTKSKVEIPLMVSKEAIGGLKELKVNINYVDTAGIKHTKTDMVYPEIIGNGATTKPKVIISGVQQFPAQPMAGEKLEVSFDLENKSQQAITDIKISSDNLSGNTFIPIGSEPYQYIERLEGESKIRITIPLIVSNNIQEGLNYLNITYSYESVVNPNDGDSVEIPIRNVVNDLGSSSKPKLRISNYTADVEELRAGSTFNFIFDLYNTNSSVAAKNIIIKVSQPENVFAVTQGSNSFFISKLDAGETVQNTLELKVKSDASTRAYELIITIEYEYDGAEKDPTTGKIDEITDEHKLNLQAVENARPVVDYVNVYSWDGAVMVFSPATLAFEFYNMGKSPLNNVIATVEGDFTKADGSMYFIGNIMEGGSTYAEFEVMPNVEGMARGILKVTFEDSNGDEIEFIKEFETMVMGEQIYDPGMNDGGYDDVFNPSGPLAKKAILPLWLFILIQVAVFVLFIFITRKVIISVYKSKLRKKEEEKY